MSQDSIISPNNSIDLHVLLTILQNLVTVPEDIVINRMIDEQGVLLSVKVNSVDMRLVIGKNGGMSNAIKQVMRAVGKAHKMNIRISFLEPDGSNRYVKSENSSLNESNLNSPNSDNVEDTEPNLGNDAEFTLN
jgi:uncharacterized protein